MPRSNPKKRPTASKKNDNDERVVTNGTTEGSIRDIPQPEWTRDHHLVGTAWIHRLLPIPVRETPTTNYTKGSSDGPGRGGDEDINDNNEDTNISLHNNSNNSNHPHTNQQHVARRFQVSVQSVPVTLFHPEVRSQRLPALWRAVVLAQSSSSSTVLVGRAIDAVAPEFQQQQRSIDTNNSGTDPDMAKPTIQLLPVVKERVAQVAIQTVLQQWLPTLILVAALEECQSTALNQMVSSSSSTLASTNTTTPFSLVGDNGSYSHAITSSLLYPYYKDPPNSYRNEEKKISGSGGEEETWYTQLPGQFTPAQLLQRIKHGCLMAWQQFEQEHSHWYSNEEGTSTTTPRSTSGIGLQSMTRSSRRIALQQQEQQQQHPQKDLTSSMENREQYDPIRQRWRVVPGGKVATYLLYSRDRQSSHLKESRDEPDRVLEKSESSFDPKKSSSDKQSQDGHNQDDNESSPGNIRSSETTNHGATVADNHGAYNNNDDDHVVDHDDNVKIPEDDDNNNDENESDADGKDEDYEDKNNDDDEEEDEDLMEVDETIEVDHESIGNQENEENEENENDESSQQKEEEYEDDVNLVLGDNPYLRLPPEAVLEWLGRKTAKWLSTHELEECMTAMIARLPKKKGTKNTTDIDACSVAVTNDVRSLLSATLWRRMVKDDTINWDDARFSFTRLNDDEDTQFGRTSLALRVIWGDSTALGRRDRVLMQQQALQTMLKDRWTWESWRYKGLTNGCAVWPSWIATVDQWRRDREHEAPSDVAESYATFDPAVMAAEDIPLSEVVASTRRSRRSDGIFYGAQSSMTQKQLMDAILRLISQNFYQTIPRLVSSVRDDSTDPLRRIRVALGKLLWKRNQIARLKVEPRWSDSSAWASIAGESGLVSFDRERTKAIDIDESDVLALERYIKQLHETELCLRDTLMNSLTEVPIAYVATAADERPGSQEAMDNSYFDDGDVKCEWLQSGNPFLGSLIFRPVATVQTDEIAVCTWFRVVDYTESVAMAPTDEPEELAQIGNAKEPCIVERRRRFRVVSESGSGGRCLIILTEAQVNAGLKAAELERLRSVSAEGRLNPFAAPKSVQITLLAPSHDPLEIIDGSVVGHDTILADGVICHRILILPCNGTRGLKNAFWARLLFPDDGTTLCKPEGIQDKVYLLQQFDYHPSSPAYQECQSILAFLKRHPKAGPFMDPVDPIALKIPEYLHIIKSPMDISTLERNLENGKYSNIPLSEAKGRTAIARMLNGPFRKDVELIFDNAILFNEAGHWISQSAATLKKAVLKKIDQAVDTAEERPQSQFKARHSVYVDDDSDIDMYTFESDHDDDFNGSGGRSRKRKLSVANTVKEDASTRAIERGTRIQKMINDQTGLRGPLSKMHVQTEALMFALPPGWTCRNQEGEVLDSKSAGEESQTELDELIALQKSIEVDREAATSRRATRTHHSEGSYKNETKVIVCEYTNPTYNKLDNHVPLPKTRAEVELACERIHEEYFSKLYYRLQKFVKVKGDAAWGVYTDGAFPPYLGRVIPMPTFSADCKRISLDGVSIRWEIREANLVPAVRWVIRGLLQSEHLAQLETLDSSSNLILPNNVYYIDPESTPFDVVDTKELTRRKRASATIETSKEEVELSEYEKMRAERVARNAARLKELGLA